MAKKKKARSRKKPKAPKPWGGKEDQILLDGTGTYGWVWLERYLKGRTREAIRARLRRVAGTSSFTKYSYTLARATKETGYDLGQLKRARGALGQKWHRMSSSGAYLITEDQLEDMVRWLQHDYWAPRHHRYSCCWCAAGDIQPFALGLCLRCYHQSRRLCKRLGVPLDCKGQLSVAKVVAPLFPGDILMDRIIARLSKGTALDRPWLLGLAIRMREGSRRWEELAHATC